MPSFLQARASINDARKAMHARSCGALSASRSAVLACLSRAACPAFSRNRTSALSHVHNARESTRTASEHRRARRAGCWAGSCCVREGVAQGRTSKLGGTQRGALLAYQYPIVACPCALSGQSAWSLPNADTLRSGHANLRAASRMPAQRADPSAHLSCRPLHSPNLQLTRFNASQTGHVHQSVSPSASGALEGPGAGSLRVAF